MSYGIFIGKYNKKTMSKVHTFFFSNNRYYYGNSGLVVDYKVKTTLSSDAGSGMLRAGPAILVFWSEQDE